MSPCRACARVDLHVGRGARARARALPRRGALRVLRYRRDRPHRALPRHRAGRHRLKGLPAFTAAPAAPDRQASSGRDRPQEHEQSGVIRPAISWLWSAPRSAHSSPRSPIGPDAGSSTACSRAARSIACATAWSPIPPDRARPSRCRSCSRRRRPLLQGHRHARSAAGAAAALRRQRHNGRHYDLQHDQRFRRRSPDHQSALSVQARDLRLRADESLPRGARSGGSPRRAAAKHALARAPADRMALKNVTAEIDSRSAPAWPRWTPRPRRWLTVRCGGRTRR